MLINRSAYEHKMMNKLYFNFSVKLIKENRNVLRNLIEKKKLPVVIHNNYESLCGKTYLKKVHLEPTILK